MDKNICTIYIVRHGESEANLADVRGADTKLTKTGKKQVQEFAQKHKHIHFDAIFSSPLIRAQETATIIAEERKLEILTKEALRERFSGELDGKKYEEIKEELTKYNTQRKELPYEQAKSLAPAQGYESDEMIMSRFITALREIGVAYPGKRVLVAGHWGLMRTFLVHTGYKTFKELIGYKFNNLASIIIQTDGVDFFIMEVNGLEKNPKYMV
ncbi:MAG: histidine phosphatase family protein [Patescibacteria group bacterium]